MSENIHTGECLCGSVRFEIHDELRGIVNCHCSKCRKFNGNFGAYTSVLFDRLKIIADKGLKWYKSTKDETSKVYRGFCAECGSSLFWHPRDQAYIAITAGALSEPTNLKTISHVWVRQKGDYYEINDDLPKFEESGNKE